MSTDYDPAVIKAYADSMYLEADRAPFLFCMAAVVVAATAGLGFGMGLDHVPAAVTMSTILGVVSGVAGLLVGRSVSARMRLAAQQALCQVAIEQRLRDMGPAAAPAEAAASAE